MKQIQKQIPKEGQVERTESGYKNIAVAIDSLVLARDSDIQQIRDDVTALKAKTQLDFATFMDLWEMCSRWIGLAGVAVKPLQPDLIKRPISYLSEQEEKKTETEEKEEGKMPEVQPPILMKATPLISELKVTDIMDYGTMAEAMRVIPVEMQAAMKRLHGLYVRSCHSPMFARTYGIQSVQLDLMFRAGKVEAGVRAAYNALISELIVTLGKVQQAALAATAFQRHARPIIPVTGKSIGSVTPQE